MSKPFVSSTISGRGGEEGKRLPEESRINARWAISSAASMSALSSYMRKSIASMHRSSLLLVRGMAEGDNDCFVIALC